MSEVDEVRIIEFETAKNKAMDEYFNTRTKLIRTKHSELIFEAGFSIVWKLMGDNDE